MDKVNKEQVYLEILNKIVIAYHSDEIDPSATLPHGHSIVFAEVDDPASLVGLSETYVDVPPKDRPNLYEPTQKSILYNQLRSISIEIDLTVRMGNDPRDLENQFDTIKAQYDALINPVIF